MSFKYVVKAKFQTTENTLATNFRDYFDTAEEATAMFYELMDEADAVESISWGELFYDPEDEVVDWFVHLKDREEIKKFREEGK